MPNIKEIALKHAREYLTFKLGGRKGLDVEEIVCDDEIYKEIVNELAQQFEALIAELAKQNEPVAINEPNYHYEAMGCGLEDRGITDRYEAMEYGWNCAIERMFEQLPKDPLFTIPPTAEQIANETAEACARYVNRFINGDGILNEVWISDIESALRNGEWRKFVKEV